MRLIHTQCPSTHAHGSDHFPVIGDCVILLHSLQSLSKMIVTSTNHIDTPIENSACNLPLGEFKGRHFSPGVQLRVVALNRAEVCTVTDSTNHKDQTIKLDDSYEEKQAGLLI